jgi:arylformamidase
MPIYDLSVPLSNEMPTWPGDPGIEIGDWQSIANGDGANVSVLKFGAHTGTHIDAPAHFIEGAKKLESVSLDVLMGEAQVVEVPESYQSIDEDFVLTHCASGTVRVLFKTRNSRFWSDPTFGFRKDFTYLDLEAARRLVELGVKLVGIDYLSIEKFGNKGHETHLALLSHDVVIVEGLNLGGINAGTYELICLPLRLRSGKGDGGPARAVLRTIDA